MAYQNQSASSTFWRKRLQRADWKAERITRFDFGEKTVNEKTENQQMRSKSVKLCYNSNGNAKTPTSHSRYPSTLRRSSLQNWRNIFPWFLFFIFDKNLFKVIYERRNSRWSIPEHSLLLNLYQKIWTTLCLCVTIVAVLIYSVTITSVLILSNKLVV